MCIRDRHLYKVPVFLLILAIMFIKPINTLLAVLLFCTVSVSAQKKAAKYPVSYTHLDVYKRQVVSFKGVNFKFLVFLFLKTAEKFMLLPCSFSLEAKLQFPASYI